MVSTVISKIISMQPNFTVSENVISQYVIGHAEQILTTTITALADETGTSEASINRFCKKLGYKGFNGLKIALAQESFYNNMVQETPSSGGNFIAPFLKAPSLSHQAYSSLFVTVHSAMSFTNENGDRKSWITRSMHHRKVIFSTSSVR